MRTDEAFYNIFMYLYNKNVLEYAQIARNETESRILCIEGCSKIYIVGIIQSQGFDQHSIKAQYSHYYKSRIMLTNILSISYEIHQ